MVFCNFHFFLIYRLHNFPNVSFGFDHTHKIFSPHPFYIEISFLNILEWFYNLAKLPQCKYYLFVDDISFEHFFLLYTKSNFWKHGFLSNITCISSYPFGYVALTTLILIWESQMFNKIRIIIIHTQISLCILQKILFAISYMVPLFE